jgi:hypothetical protein
MSAKADRADQRSLRLINVRSTSLSLSALDAALFFAIRGELSGEEGFAALENEVAECFGRGRSSLGKIIHHMPAAHDGADLSDTPMPAMTACLIASLLDICITIDSNPSDLSDCPVQT